MPSFALMCFDNPGGLALRVTTREAHLAYLDGFGGQVVYGGPLLDAQDQACGSLIVVEMESLADAEAFSASDPYRLAGLFERVEIRGLRPILGRA